jgi:hypothetical protein
MTQLLDTYQSQATDATGYSAGMSFDEAFQDALKGLQQTTPSGEDEIERVFVVALGAETGGFAGLSRLFVTIRPDPSRTAAIESREVAARQEPAWRGQPTSTTAPSQGSTEPHSLP